MGNNNTKTYDYGKEDIFDVISNIDDLDELKKILSPDDFNRRHCYGETLLHAATSNKKIGSKIIKFLVLDKKIDVNSKLPGTKGRGGSTPLHYAVANKNCDAVETLLRLGADPEIKNVKGQNVYQLAGCSKELKTVSAKSKGEGKDKESPQQSYEKRQKQLAEEKLDKQSYEKRLKQLDEKRLKQLADKKLDISPYSGYGSDKQLDEKRLKQLDEKRLKQLDEKRRLKQYEDDRDRLKKLDQDRLKKLAEDDRLKKLEQDRLKKLAEDDRLKKLEQDRLKRLAEDERLKKLDKLYDRRTRR